MSAEDPLRSALTGLDTAGPSASYVADLRRRLHEEMTHSDPSTNSEVMMITTETNPHSSPQGAGGRSRQRLALIGLAAAVFLALAIGALWNRGSGGTSTGQDPADQSSTTDQPPTTDQPSTTTTEPTTTTEALTTLSERAMETLDVGNAWIDSILDNDREAFEALHAPAFVANDTLMAWTGLVPGGMNRETIAEFYFEGFDAFQASIETDGDVIEVDGCEITGGRDEVVRCSFRASLIGGEEMFTVLGDLTVEDGLIASITFYNGNEPPGLVSGLPGFLREFGTEQDLACRDIGFNSAECGRHESDLLTRYLDFLEETGGS